MAEPLILGIDIGGTNIKAGLVSESGELVDHVIATTPQHRDMPEVVAAVAQAVKPLLARLAVKPKGMGVAAAGVVDLAGDHVLRAPNFPSWKHVPLRAAIVEALGLPAVLGNDVDVFGIAEHRWGAAVGLRHFVAVAVGTGVGGAVFINGELYRGADGGAAELGFTVIEPDSRKILNVAGALEAFIGRRGFDEMVLALFQTGEVPTPRRITEMANAGDERARQVHTQIAAYLAEAAASWLHILNPEALVLGGGTLAGADFLLAEFDRLLRGRALKTHTDQLKILPSKLGYFAGVQGAAALWLSEHTPS